MAPAPAPSSTTVLDLTIGIMQLTLKGGKEKDRGQSNFRVHYFITLSEKCCHSGGKRIPVGSNNVLVWARGEDNMDRDPAMEMKALTLLALQRHKDEAKKRERIAASNAHQIPVLSHKQI